MVSTSRRMVQLCTNNMKTNVPYSGYLVGKKVFRMDNSGSSEVEGSLSFETCEDLTESKELEASFLIQHNKSPIEHGKMCDVLSTSENSEIINNYVAFEVQDSMQTELTSGSHLFKTCEDPTESQHLEVSLLSRQHNKTPVNHRKLSDTFPLSSTSPNFEINEENYIVLEEKDSIQKDLIAESSNKLNICEDLTKYKEWNVSFVHLSKELDISVSKKHKKKYYCSYCNKTVTNFGRHLLTLHKNKEEVQTILEYPKGHPKRIDQIAAIRKAAQYKFNSTSALNNGHLIVTRRPSENKNRTASHYKACPNCKQMYSKLSLRAHYALCSTTKKGGRGVIVASKRCQMSVHPGASERLATFVLAHCREDEILEEILFDELCIKYGNKLCQKYRNQHHSFMIRTRLRELGKFIKEVKKNHHVNNLRDILVPSNYDKIVNAINKVAGFDEVYGTYRAPSTAYNLGLHIKAVTGLLQCEYIKESNLEKRTAVNDLLCLMNNGFQTDINKTVNENQCEKRRHKKVLLPTAEDIQALKTFLKRGMKNSYDVLKSKFSFKAWKDLAGYTLISIQLFNRKRAGELERILIEDYRNYHFVNVDDPIYKNFEKNLKVLGRRYARFFIRGKLNRQVSVILSRDHINYIDLLLKHRKQFGVAEGNPYVFGTVGRTENTYLRACNLMRYYAKSCGAPNPKSLRGTELRKQIATACKIYKLPDFLLEDIADHLGHNIDVHKTIYRQSVGTEIPGVAQILLKAMGGDNDSDNTDESCSENSENTTFSKKNISLPTKASLSNENTILNRETTMTNVKQKRTSWTDPEIEAVRRSFGEYIELGVVPTFEECHKFREENPCLLNRTPPQIKSFVVNQTKKKRDLGQSKGKRTWSSAEKSIVQTEFADYLKTKTLPHLNICKQVIASHPTLQNRTPVMLKAFVNNMNKKRG